MAQWLETRVENGNSERRPSPGLWKQVSTSNPVSITFRAGSKALYVCISLTSIGFGMESCRMFLRIGEITYGAAAWHHRELVPGT